MSRATSFRIAGMRHLQTSTGSAESHDPSTAPAKRALPCFGAAYGNEITCSQPTSWAASPAGSSPGPWVVTSVTRCRRVSSARMWKLRDRPPVLSGQSPPTFTQRIRICLPWTASHPHGASDVPNAGANAWGTETPAVGAEERTMAGTQPGKPRMLTQCGPRAPPAVLRDRDTRAPGGRWPAFVGG